MFLDNLGKVKKVALFKYLEKGDFNGYDFFIEENSIKNGKDLLDFLNLFVDYNCFIKNFDILDALVAKIYKYKSVVILYEAYLLNTDSDIENIIGKYSKIISKESFEFEGVLDLLDKTRDVINNNGNNIIIYNSINNVLGFKDSEIYFNFLLELFEIKYSSYFKEINLILDLLIYGSNKALVKQMNELVFYFEHKYNINNNSEKKYVLSIINKLIKNISCKNIDYKTVFIKNILNFLGKNDFYIEFFENNENIRLKELLLLSLLGALNENNLTIDGIKKDIKKNLINDKNQINNLVKDFRKDIKYIEDKKESSYADYIIDKI